MNYDPNLENPMVTKQGGSLTGKVLINNGQGFNGWAGKIEITKPVSRPWVEWIKDELTETESLEEAVEGKSASEESQNLPLPPDYNGPTTLALNQPREVTFTYLETGTDFSCYPSKLNILFEGSDVVIETPLPIDITGNNQLVKLKVKGVKLTENPSLPTKMKVTIQHNGQLRSNYLYEMPVWVFDAGIAVDYNRDGEIHFAYENVPDDKKDEIPSGKYYEFWVNDDHDMPNDEGVEDDVEDGLKDSQFNGIAYLRGLEDFTRLWIKRCEAIFGQKEFSYGLRFEEVKSEAPPRIKVFYATDLDGGTGYLKDEVLGQNQLSTMADSHYAGDIGNSPIKALLFIDARKSNGHYIFEGVKEGKGNLALRVFYGGVNVAKYVVPLQIRAITDFYEEYSVGVNDDSPDIAPLSTPIAIRSQVSAAIDENEKDYILFVHGWNMENPTKKRRWAETAYKRLWWQGYKGRFGLFRWPNANFNNGWLCNNFNMSEYNAWKSGEGLLNLIKEMRSMGKNYSIYLYAHSQGNVVVGEALREAADEQLQSPLVDGYVATQAAISSSLYVTSPVRYFETQERNWTYTTPIDFPAHYPNGKNNDKPYMDGTKEFCRNWINFYNPQDIGVGDDANISFLDRYILSICGEKAKQKVCAWEYNNKVNRPWNLQSPTQDYPNYAYDAWQEKFVLYYDDENGYNQRTLDPSNHDDRFKIFSFAAQSYGVAVGGGPLSLDYFANVNLADPQVNINFGQSRADHSGQFMYGIQRVGKYWEKVMDVLNLRR